MNLDELIEEIERVKKRMGFDKKVAQSSPLARSLEKHELKSLELRGLENRVRNRANPRIIQLIIESGILDERT